MRKAPRKYFTKRLHGRARRLGVGFSQSKEPEAEGARAREGNLLDMANKKRKTGSASR
jgi:hypothetical protein